jgi:AraC-like DNA-binding protein
MRAHGQKQGAHHSMSAAPAASRLIYSELKPPSDLARWIACLWQIRGECTPGSLHRVLPDGCGDLVLDLAAAHCGHRIDASVVGPMTRARSFALAGCVDFLGVRFRPGGVSSFAGFRATHLVDTVVPLAETAAIEHALIEQLAISTERATRMDRLIAVCRARLHETPGTDPAVAHALTRLEARTAGELPRISVLARDLGLSERSLERRFTRDVGFTPVHFRRLARFRAALRLHATRRQQWAQIALDTGFSDQAHLARDFREFAGITPIEWALTQRAPAGFLQDGRLTAL